jgi:hypothetical protein
VRLHGVRKLKNQHPFQIAEQKSFRYDKLFIDEKVFKDVVGERERKKERKKSYFKTIVNFPQDSFFIKMREGKGETLFLFRSWSTGLPDFSRSKHTKAGKYTK